MRGEQRFRACMPLPKREEGHDMIYSVYRCSAALTPGTMPTDRWFDHDVTMIQPDPGASTRKRRAEEGGKEHQQYPRSTSLPRTAMLVSMLYLPVSREEHHRDSLVGLSTPAAKLLRNGRKAAAGGAAAAVVTAVARRKVEVHLQLLEAEPDGGPFEGRQRQHQEDPWPGGLHGDGGKNSHKKKQKIESSRY